VIPAIVNDAVVLAGSEQPAPASVIVTVLPLVAPVAVQLVNPPVSAIVGVAGIEIPLLVLSATVIVLPATSAPLAEALNPAVQVAIDAAVAGDAAKVTFVTAEKIVTPLAGFAATVSSEVLTLKSALG